MLKCPKCGAEMSDNAKICSRCATPLETPTPPQAPPPNRMTKRGCLILVLVAVAIVALVVGVGVNSVNGSTFGRVTGMTDEQETAAIEIFTQCGIGDITSAELFHAGETQSSYYIDDEETAVYSGANGRIVVWIENDTKKVNAIYYREHDIYVDGEVVSKVTDYYVPSALRDEYRVSVQLAVNKLLAYPDTAKYPAKSGWAFGVTDDGHHAAQSTVTSNNALGVAVTTDIQAIFDDYGNIISLTLDGVEYMQ